MSPPPAAAAPPSATSDAPPTASPSHHAVNERGSAPPARPRCWFIWWDPCGLSCWLFGLATVAFVNYVTVAKIVAPWLGATSPFGLAALAPFELLIGLILFTYVRAAATDPGSVIQRTATAADAVPRADDPDYVWKPRRRFCDKCQALKPTAHHHCPWINNCVGAHNLRFFLQFLLFTFLGSLTSLGLAATRLVGCWRGWWADPTTAVGRAALAAARAYELSLAAAGAAGRPAHYAHHHHHRGLGGGGGAGSVTCAVPAMPDVIVLVVCAVLALFFAIFTAAMFWDQYEGMTTNTTAIESMKGWEEEDRPLLEGLGDYCGYPGPSWRWFVPVGLGPSSPAWFSGVIAHPDEYHPRDPAVQSHFRRIEAQIAAGHRIVFPAPPSEAPPPRQPDGAADAAAVNERGAAAALSSSRVSGGAAAAGQGAPAVDVPGTPSEDVQHASELGAPARAAKQAATPTTSTHTKEPSFKAAQAHAAAPAVAAAAAAEAVALREAAAEARAEAEDAAEATASPPGCMARMGHGHHAPCGMAACVQCDSSSSSSSSSDAGAPAPLHEGEAGGLASAAAGRAAASGAHAPDDAPGALGHDGREAAADEAPPPPQSPALTMEAAPDVEPDASVLPAGPSDEGARAGAVRRRAGRRREA